MQWVILNTCHFIIGLVPTNNTQAYKVAASFTVQIAKLREHYGFEEVGVYKIVRGPNNMFIIDLNRGKIGD